jgi:hypothetical protein
MGLDLWFREDVTRILASAHEAMRASTVAMSAPRSALTDAYQQGFVDALRAVGVAFGVCLRGSLREPCENLGTQVPSVVDATILASRSQPLDLHQR